MKKEKQRSLVSFFVSFLLTVTLFLTTGCFLLLATVCNKDALLRTVRETDYSVTLCDEIRDKWDNLASICGVTDREVLLQIVTPEKVQEDSLNYLEGSYSGSSALDITALKDRLENAVRAYLSTQDLTASDESELESNIADFLDACMADYKDSIQIPLAPTLLKKTVSLRKILFLGEIGGAAFSVFLILLVFTVQKMQIRTLPFLFDASCANALLFLFIYGFITFGNFLNRLPFEASALKNLVVAFCRVFLNRIAFCSLIFMILSVTLLLPYIIFEIRKNLKKKR